MKQNYLVIGLIAILCAAGGFFGGMKYQQSKQPTFGQMRNFQGQRNGTNALNGQQRQGFRPVRGEVLSIDRSSLTIKQQDGSSKIVILNEKTEINKAQKATIADIKTGELVAAFGQEATGGTLTAQSIQINPALSGMGTPNNQPPQQ